MNHKKAIATLLLTTAVASWAQSGNEPQFTQWASTPPMGWNSWDCYGPTVVESEVKSNADYMATHLKESGWEYVVVDIRWYVENDKAGGYNQTNPIYVIDDFGRYTPALNRFPSAADGKGFKPLADYVHSKGLKFGIHLMRGIPKEAVAAKLPVRGTEGITCDMIANNDSSCTWLRDNMKVDWSKPGAQQYYNSCFDMYADWGVDFVKIDDLARPYHTAEIEMIRRAIDNCSRPMVLSISPGETPIDRVDHVKTHANMWRTVDDFWDNWSQLNYQFEICAKWAPYIAPGTWPDADMLPLGKISIRGERGAERYTNFTPAEQQTLMTLWTIFRSPLMFGGDLPQNDAATNALITNPDVLYMHRNSTANRQVTRDDDKNLVVWSADDPLTGDKYMALFNVAGSQFVNAKKALYRSGTISYLTTGHSTPVNVELPQDTKTLALIVTDGGDGFDCDHADWINPTVTLADGTKLDLTTLNYTKGTCGWGEIHINSNINGGRLSINGTPYDKGIATHANSAIVYQLPSAAIRFEATAGIDNTGSNQGSKSSVEFLVYNYDPTDPTLPADDDILETPVDLAAIGIAPDVTCTITDMWQQRDVATCSGNTYSTTLAPHASALYRITPLDRKGTPKASISVSGSNLQSCQPFDITAQVTGVATDSGYLTIQCDGKTLTTLPIAPDGTIHYTATLTGGSHTIKAIYSGTDRIIPATSSDLTIVVNGATEDLSQLNRRLETLLQTATGLNTDNIPALYRQPLAQAITLAGETATDNRLALENTIATLQLAVDNATLAVFYKNKLLATIEESEAFAITIKDGDSKQALVDAVNSAKALLHSPDTTIDALKDADKALIAALAQAKLTGDPIEGNEIEVTSHIVNPSFEESTNGWTWANNCGGWESVATWSDRPADHGTYFISLAGGTITSLNLYQDIASLPAGEYRLEASLRNTDSADHLTNQHIYARVGSSTVESITLTTVSGPGNNDWTTLSVDGINIAQGKKLRIGAASNGDGTSNRGWFQADNFRLYYKGSSGIDAIMSTQALTLGTIPGHITATATQPTTVDVYLPDGRIAATLHATQGTSLHPMNPGMYIARGHKLIVR